MSIIAFERLLEELATTNSPQLHFMGSKLRETDLMAKLNIEMRQLEAAKYPQPPYKCKIVNVHFNNQPARVMHVQYDGTPLTQAHFDHISVNTMRLRKLSTLASVAYAMNFSDKFLTPDPRQRELIKQELNKLISQTKSIDSQPDMMKQEIETFISTLAKKLSDITGNPITEIIRHMRNAERYFVAEYNQNLFQVNEVELHNEIIIQIDVPFNHVLTDELKKDYLAIHQLNPNKRPIWFTNLAAWEKQWFKKMVPKQLNGDWTRFENTFQTSAMIQAPGIMNARTGYLFAKNANEELKLLSSNFKMGTTVPYGMPSKECKTQTEKSIEQVLDHLSNATRERFKDTWQGTNLPAHILPLVYVNTLLSDTAFSAKDTKLMRLQRKAVAKKAQARKYKDVQIISGNEPVNFLRFISAETGLLSKLFGRWHHTQRLLNYGLALQQHLEKAQGEGLLSNDQQEKFTLLKQARAQLINLQKSYRTPRVDRNFSAFKAAYTQILMQATGNFTSTNCKSGKDRTGLDEIYRQAMLLYFKHYHRLPSYDDNTHDRQKFIAIFIVLFNSLKNHEAAAMNTPGSFGLKDNAKMLCPDIVEALGASYKCSNQWSNLNKPPSFLKDEKLQSREIRGAIPPSSIQKIDVPLQISQLKRKQLMTLLIEQREQLVRLMANLDTYLSITQGKNKQNAQSLYNVMDQLNKRISQVEASLKTSTVKSLAAFITDLNNQYTKAVNHYSRNNLQRAYTFLQGNHSNYDQILEQAKPKKLDDSFLSKIKR